MKIRLFSIRFIDLGLGGCNGKKKIWLFFIIEVIIQYMNSGGANHFFVYISGGRTNFYMYFKGGEKIFNGNFLRLATYMSHYHCILPNYAIFWATDSKFCKEVHMDCLTKWESTEVQKYKIKKYNKSEVRRPNFKFIFLYVLCFLHFFCFF